MYFILVILFSLSAFATPTNKELSESSKWMRLLHYKKTWYGTYKSEADGEKFFLHKDGKTNPELELEKAIEVFGRAKVLDDTHPVCKFPLRFKWLNRELGMPWKVDLGQCQKYVSFFSKLAARRASVVFSSYYLSNPNSAFGHTLLRLSRFDDRNETEMLDYGINYSAAATETNPFLYAVKGLFGGFQGEFAAIPYYYKVREYSNFEFRDLWSYDLKLNTMQVLEMVDHIWELGHTHFDYFYFHENCSYHLLSIIDVALPDKNLTGQYHLYTIPADTIRLLQREGLIEEGKRRESTYSKLTRLSEGLTSDSLKTAKKISHEPRKTANLIQGMDNQKAADILDVAMEAFDYYNFEKILKDDPKTKEEKSYILKERAKNPVITYDQVDPIKTRKDSPALSHSPTRLTLAEGYESQQGKYSKFEFRAALHDVLDPAAGSLKEAQLELAKLSFRLQDRSYTDPQLIFNHLSIFNIKNYPEQNFWSSPMSWEIDVGGKQLNRLTCFDCPAVFLMGSLGNSLTINHQKILLSILLNSEIDIQSQFENNYRFGLGPKVFARYRASDKWVMGLTSFYHFNTYEHQKFFQDYEWVSELELRHHLSEKLSIALKGNGVERERFWDMTSELGLQYFYE